MFSFIKKILGLSQSKEFENVSAIIFGIGNIGSRYKDTKHNIGFSIVDALLQNCTKIKQGTWCDCDISICSLTSGKIVALVKPQTYVNRSGFALAKLLKRYSLPLSSFLVIVDDYNLPLGMIRFRPKGSHGGHKGLMSIISEAGKGFSRLRVGIGPLPNNMDVVDFVLSPFETGVLKKKDAVIKKATEGVFYFCENGIEAAMNKFNKRE